MNLIGTSTPALGRLGDFEVLRELGRGGMGVVYEARQVSLNRKVALKVLSGGFGLTGKAVTRFKREAEAAAKLHHTNIVPIYATGEEEGTYFYAMELIEGPSLDKVIKQMRHAGLEKSGERQVTTLASSAERTALDSQQLTRGSEDSAKESPNLLGGEASAADTTSSLGEGSGYFDTVARIIAEVADALDYAHKQGVIHRDIKPSNLLLSADGRLHINDFGLARMLEQPGMTISGEFLGSPAYMSPEQIAAGRLPLDHRTDIYSLGVVLYELLTLRQPFSGSSRDQVLAQIVQKEPKPPRSLNKRVPADLETICLKAMEKDPDRRYQSAGAMAEDLCRFVNRFAISARRANLLQRSVKWARRHPALAALGTVALIAVLGAFSFALQARTAAEKLKSVERRKAIDEAMLLAMAADFANAEKAIGEAEAVGASPGETRFLRGLLAFHRGLLNEAVVHLRQATNQSSIRVAAYALLSEACIAGGEWQEGESLLPVIEKLRPETSLDHLMVGQVLSSVFDPARAMSYIDKGVELGAGAISRLIRAQVLTRLAQATGRKADVDKAIADAENANTLLGNTNILAIAATVQAQLAKARICEGNDEVTRMKTLDSARQHVKALAKHTNSSAAAWARINYFDYTGDDSAYAGEIALLYRNFNTIFNADRYSTLLFGNGESEEAYRIAKERASPSASLQIAALADVTRNVQYAYEAYKQLAPVSALWDSFYKPHDLLWLGRTDEARSEIRALRDAFSFYFRYREGWYEHLFNYYIGEIDENLLLERAGDSRWNLCEAHFAIGMIKLSEGQRAAAKWYFEQCAKTRVYHFVEYFRARALVKRMERDPNWPPWIPTKNDHQK